MTFCYDIPVDFWRRCMWCDVKGLCREDGELAARDSDHCRYLQYHVSKRLVCDEGRD